MASEPVNDELLDLIGAACDEAIEPEQVQRLELLLRDNPEARWTYLRYVHLEGSLSWGQSAAAEHAAIHQLRRAADERLPGQTADQAASPATRERRPVVVRGASSRLRVPSVDSRYFLAASTLAACVLLALSLRWGLWQTPAPHATFAHLAHAIDAVWADGETIPIGTALGQGRLRLLAGLARVDFDNGASVTLEGPAEFALLSGDRTVLHAGQLTTHVPAAAFGFRVDTPSMNVVDLGTGFGVAVDPDGTADVCIFEGDVVVAPAKRKSSSERHWLKAGDAVRMTAGSDTIDRVDFSAKRFMRSWPVTFGVLDATGVVKFDPPGYPFAANDIEDDERIIIIAERDRVELPANVFVNLVEPGKYPGKPIQRQHLPAGQDVRSYLLQFNPVGKADGSFRLQGSVTFDRPIVGVISSSELLAASDDLLGASVPDATFDRGLEAIDFVTLSADRRTVILDWRAGVSRDQIRLLVAAPSLPAESPSAQPAVNAERP